MAELKTALDVSGFKIPQYQMRQRIDKIDEKKSGRLSFEQFEQVQQIVGASSELRRANTCSIYSKLCIELKSNDVSSAFKQVVSKRDNLQRIGGMSEASSEGTTHSVLDS